MEVEGTYVGSELRMTEISMFMAQSGPISKSLVALSTQEFTIFKLQFQPLQPWQRDPVVKEEEDE